MLYPWDRNDFYVLPCAAKLLWIYLRDHGLNEMSSIYIQKSQLESLLGAELTLSIALLRESSFIKVKSVSGEEERGFKFISQIDLGTKYEIPLKDGTMFVVTEDIILRLSQDFPEIDVHAKIKEIIRWNVRNPTHRKTLRGIMKHIECFFSNTKGFTSSLPALDKPAQASSTQAIKAAQSAAEYQAKTIVRPSSVAIEQFKASLNIRTKGDIDE